MATQPLTRIRWQTTVDRNPQYSGDQLLAHYGSPLITQANTVIVPVKAGASRGFRVEARRGDDGTALWRKRSNYRMPPHHWLPPFAPVLSALNNKLWMPAIGGTVLSRTAPDNRHGDRQRVAYYGIDNFRHSYRAYRDSVFINTPLSADAAGNIYFGVLVTGPTPTNLASVLVRLSDGGQATTITPALASADATMTQVAYNCAPALSNDGTRVYVAVNDHDRGYLVALDSTTLAPLAAAALKDPSNGDDAFVYDDSTASPTVGPDGDVYFGVLERPLGAHNIRGWLLHFDSDLNPKSPPGSFGWDSTAAIVPAATVPSYAGASSYLLMTKYNNYAGAGSGDGVNRIAVLDPNAEMLDPISGTVVMNEVMTIAGPTPDTDHLPDYPNAVREWCINSAAVDPVTKSILANNEDGKLYRWDLSTGTLSESIVLTTGLGEAYTPTLLGPDGTVYAINNGILFAVGQ